MKITILIVMISFSLFMAGCAWMDPTDPNLTQKNTDQGFLEESPDFFGKVLDPKRFAKGGSLVIVPFSPGENVFADQKFDKITLKIIKGIADVFDQENSAFMLVFSQDAQKADLILTGQILELKKAKGIKKLLGGNLKTIDLRARMIDRNDQSLVAVFEGVRSEDTTEFEVLAYMIGEEIGRFLAETK